MYIRTVVITALLVVCASTTMWVNAGVKKNSDEQDNRLLEIPRVGAVRIERTTGSRAYRAACSVYPSRTYSLSTMADGRVKYIRSGKNQAVAGDVLMEIDSPSADYQYKTAVITWRTSALKLQRNSASGLSQSKTVLDELKLNEETTRREVEYLKEQIDSLSIVAPEDGLYEVPEYSIGDQVSAFVPLLKFYGDAEFEFSAKLPLRVFQKIDKSQTLSLVEVESQLKIGESRIGKYEPEDDGEFVRVRGTVDELFVRNDSLFSKCNTVLQLPGISDSIFVSMANVHLDYKGFYVFKLVGRRAEKKYVTVSWYDTGVYEISGGLVEGDVIATAGSFKLLGNELVEFELIES